MKKNGLITRKVYDETPLKVAYFLIEKRLAIKPILDQMAAFSLEYFSKDVSKDGKPRSLQDVYH